MLWQKRALAKAGQLSQRCSADSTSSSQSRQKVVVVVVVVALSLLLLLLLWLQCWIFALLKLLLQG